MLLQMIYVFVLFGVVVLSSMAGGRYERIFGLMILAVAVGAQTSGLALESGPASAGVMLTLDLALVAGIFWLWRRDRAGWLALQLGIQAFSVPIDFLLRLREGPWDTFHKGLWWAQGVGIYLQLAILVWAVLRRHFGSPYPLPRDRPAAGAG